MTSRCVPVLAERFHPGCLAQVQADRAEPGCLFRAEPGCLFQAVLGCRRADRGQRAGWDRPEPEIEEWKALPELQALPEQSVQPGE